MILRDIGKLLLMNQKKMSKKDVADTTETDAEVVMLDDGDVEEEIGTDEIEKIPEDSGGSNLANVTLKQKREDIRGRLAFLFLIGYFIILIGSIVFSAFAEDVKIERMLESIITISGVLSGSLGFVIGYYFRRQEEGD